MTREPRVWVNAAADRAPLLETAVREAGGRCVSPDRATAIVWARDQPRSILPHLRPAVEWVQLSSAGIEEWFAAGVIDADRTWTAAKGVYARPIAEYCAMAIMAGMRRFPEVLRARRWEPLEPERLGGKTVTVLGAGGIGTALFALLGAIGVRRVAVNRSGIPVDGADSTVASTQLDDVLPETDVLVVAAPDTRATRGIVDERRLALLPPGALLVNVARGTLVDTAAVVESLRSGRLGGAFLDVTDPEPLPTDHPLWDLPTAVVTSHTASTAETGAPFLAGRVRENVARFACGEPLLGIVDATVGY